MEKKMQIGVVGFGNFGKLVTSILSNYCEVLVFETDKKPELEALIKKSGARRTTLEETAKSDIVVLCTPISKTEKAISTVAPLMKKGSLLVDTCSVKELPCAWLKEKTTDAIEIMGTHPMFGPTTSKFNIEKQSWDLRGLQIVLCPIRVRKKRLDAIKHFLSTLELHVIQTSPKEHDKQNAKTLSFVHYIGRCLQASKIGHQEIFTPGYKDLLSILPHTTSDNWTLFYDMNNFNPYSAPLRKTFIDACFALEEKILAHREGDEMEKQRESINTIDAHIIKLLEKRMRCVQTIGAIKKKKNMPVKNKAREAEVVRRLQEKSTLSEEYIKAVYKEIFKEACKNQ